MGVDWFTCSCGNVTSDHHDNIYCEDCDACFCRSCHKDEYEDEETGEITGETCPYCTKKIIKDSELLEFILIKTEVFRNEVEEMYRSHNGLS